MLAFVKGMAPYGLYAIGAVLLFLSLTGKTQWGLMFLVGLLPLTNVTDKLHSFPLGKDFVDILLIIMIIGWVIGSMVRGEKLVEKSALNTIMAVLIFSITD